MSRTTIRQHIETVVVVTVITVLVWLYAENKNVQRYNESVHVEFVSREGDEVRISPKTKRVKITFRGSSGQKQELERLRQDPIQLPVGDPTGPGTVTAQVQVAEALNKSALGDLGLQVLDTEPAVVEVSLRRMRSLTMPIEVETGDASLRGPVKVEPKKVHARMPSALSQTAQAAAAKASLETVDLSELKANVEHQRQVPLTLPEALQGHEVQIEPDEATLSFTIQRQTSTTKLTSVPIHINAPPLLLQRFNIDLPEDQLVLRNIELHGPSDVIERIKKKKVKVWAEIRPSADQLGPGQTTLQVHLRTPSGVSVDSRLPRVTVNVRRR